LAEEASFYVFVFALISRASFLFLGKPISKGRPLVFRVADVFFAVLRLPKTRFHREWVVPFRSVPSVFRNLEYPPSSARLVCSLCFRVCPTHQRLGVFLKKRILCLFFLALLPLCFCPEPSAFLRFPFPQLLAFFARIFFWRAFFPCDERFRPFFRPPRRFFFVAKGVAHMPPCTVLAFPFFDGAIARFVVGFCVYSALGA